MPRFIQFLLILPVLLAGCSGEKPESLVLVEDSFPLSGSESISIEINAGALEVRSNSTEELHISGKLADPESLEVHQSDDRIEIVQKHGQASDLVQIYVPDGSILELKTFSSDTTVEDFSGELTLNSSAGNISITGFLGSATVWAGRGDITVTESGGEMTLITEHGAVNVESFSGQISMSTIMGSLTYFGMEKDQNLVRIEADHGPVTAMLPSNANTNITASSTNGEVACVGTGIQHTVDGCQASLGTGSGTVKIRTVTGRIEIRIAGVVEEE